MTTNNLDAILNYPIHLQGAAWLYSEEHEGKLPTLGFLLKTYGKTENTVGASETTKHDPRYLALYGLMKSHVSEREALFGGNLEEDTVIHDKMTFDALGTILGSVLRDLLQTGHNQCEAARIMGIHPVTVRRKIFEARKILCTTSTN